MLDRRAFLQTPAAVGLAAAPAPVTAAVRPHNGKPTLFIREQPVYASFYALTDCTGGRWSYDENPRMAIQSFVDTGCTLFQLDVFLEDCWTAEKTFSIDPVRKQLRGILDVCPEGAVVLRWHLNAPEWWKKKYPGELVQWANGGFEAPARTQPVRYIQDDLRRLPRNSLASELWFDAAKAQTSRMLRELSRTPENTALAGVHVACGVYGEWHYWGFMRNEPDVSEPMQKHFAAWRAAKGRPAVPVPGVEERKALDDGIFRDPRRRETVIDYYRCQQELTASRIVELCATVKKSWPRPLLAGTFYGYFFSMFDRQATGGHLCLHEVLASKDVDYLSAPQAYGAHYRNAGSNGITRALIETIRANGKLFLDEMDQTPSWKWNNNVDNAFSLTDLDLDVGLIRRNILESYTRGAGVWWYDFGPANHAGWWLDSRLMKEIAALQKVLTHYHARPYQPAGDVLLVFDTEVFYYTGSIQGTDPVTDILAVNRTAVEAWKCGAAIETVHLRDLEKLDLSRFRVVMFANTWLMTAAQRRFVRERAVHPSRHVVFQGQPAYCDGQTLNAAFTREVTGMDAPGRKDNVWFFAAPPVSTADWRTICKAAGAHVYFEQDDILHAGGGLVLVHSKDGGPRRVTLRNGRVVTGTLKAKSSWVLDAETGEHVL
ncbi:MAG: hypothetical protein FJW30_13005 [Acidobacteria bacterium]|nr:hypothetical protein [Acidobacteriota bacterium]